jgi:hypothetical protein
MDVEAQAGVADGGACLHIFTGGPGAEGTFVRRRVCPFGGALQIDEPANDKGPCKMEAVKRNVGAVEATGLGSLGVDGAHALFCMPRTHNRSKQSTHCFAVVLRQFRCR